MELQQLFSTMAVELSPQTDTEALESIGQYACRAVDADDSGILLLRARGRIETPVSTSRVVNEAHARQAELDEGPCLDVVRTDTSVLFTGDAAHDPRWPQWGVYAEDRGYSSSLSVRLAVGDRRYGSLNVYARRRDAFSTSDVDALSVLGAHASVALAAARERAHLMRAVDNRTTIGQAQGVLMTVFDIDAESAFAYLTRLSQGRNVKLSEVAAEIVDQRSEIASRSKG